MKRILKHGMALLLAVVLCVSLMPTAHFAADAATVDYVYSGDYIYNWGTRGETATFLSPNAEAFYTGNNKYDDLSALAGGTGVSDAPSSALYSSLQALMVNAHDYQTSYNATKDLYQYTDCQNSGKITKAISSFYSGVAIGPAWGTAPSWNREHTWPNSKGLGGMDENDIMMLRPTASSENTSRGNKAYGESTGYYNPNSASNGAYDLRGDVSRIFLYVYVRWGNVNGNGQYSTWGTNGVMESLDILLEWMEADPVDTWELGRNDSVQAITGTRNVFVDYPELAFTLFGAEIPEDMATPSGEAANSGCEHNYVAGTPVAATCTADGYTPYTCSICEKVLKDDFTSKIDHNYVEGTCDACGAVEPRLPVTGETVAIYAPAYDMALSADKVSATSYYNKGVDVSGGFNDLTLAEKWVVTVNEDGSYSFVSGTGKKLALADSYSSLNDEGANDDWTVTAKSGADNIYYVKNTVRGSYLEWYASMNNWSTYATSSLSDLFELSFHIFKDCDHEYSSVVFDATCTDDGYTTYTCKHCGISYDDNVITAEGHKYDEDGFCTVCDEEKPEEVKYTIHFLVPEDVEAVDSIVCGEDGTLLPEAEAPTGYTFLGWSKAVVDNETKEPTFLNSGDDFVPTADTVLYALYSYVEMSEGGATTSGTANISFASTDNRTVFTTSQQVWVQNGITITNDKGSSTSNVANYSNPARFYKNSKLTVAHPGMTKIVFNCNTANYATALKNSIGAAATASSKVVTVVLSAPTDSYVIAKLSGGQVRIDSIDVEYETTGGGAAEITYYTTVIGDACAHESAEFVNGKAATCTDGGNEPDLYCPDCDVTLVTGAPIAAKGHALAVDKAAEATCTVAGWTEGSHCKRCGEVLVAQIEIQPLGHEDKDRDNFCDRCDTNIKLDDGDLVTSKGTLTGTPKMGYNIPISFDEVPANTAMYGALVWREGADEATATDVEFADGNKVIGISNIAIYGIKNVFNIKPYIIDDEGYVAYGEVVTASYLEWLLMYKDNTDTDKAAAVAQINKILDIYYAATGEAAYEGQAKPQLADAAEGTYAAKTPLSIVGDSEISVKADKPVQGSIVNGKLRINLDYGTKTGDYGVLVYKAGNEFNPLDVSTADANIVFEEGAILSVDISGIAVANYGKQYTFIPYVVDGENLEFGNTIKVSYADFMAYALNSTNANAKQVANASCELYKAITGADLCEIAE
ncbi:MAG: hypothetical protein E7560_05000 [Ruminococcaceae bacterium]|nr:hypothetical protein [Oscillospiraceae bacterium]